MRYIFGFCSFLLCTESFSQQIDSLLKIPIPTGLRPSGVLADLVFSSSSKSGRGYVGLKSGNHVLGLVKRGRRRRVEFKFEESAILVKKGRGTKRKRNAEERARFRNNDRGPRQSRNTVVWKTRQFKDSVRLWWSAAADSANDIALLSAYCSAGGGRQVKFLSTIKLNGWNRFFGSLTLQCGGSFSSAGGLKEVYSWAQASNGQWMQLSGNNRSAAPSIYLFNHFDSLAQAKQDLRRIKKYLRGLDKPFTFSEGIYYEIVEKGNGRGVKVTDTVTVFYKGSLLEDGSIFDQTAEKPATFPLSRLIKGWQLALPKINVGGKILVYLPSGMAYSIRTRSPKIPPNSILVFEIEVVDAKSAGIL